MGIFLDKTRITNNPPIETREVLSRYNGVLCLHVLEGSLNVYQNPPTKNSVFFSDTAMHTRAYVSTGLFAIHDPKCGIG